MNIPETAWIDRATCAVCGSAHAVQERRIGGFPIQRCADCGFLQTAKVLSPDALDSFYSEGYDGLRPQQGQEVNAEINMAAMRKLGLLDGSLKTLLDIGCGYGFFMQRMRDQAGIDAAGVELSQAQLDFARKDLGLTVERDVEDLPERFRKDVDLMVCFEVIEHIADPVDFLRTYAERLRPGGVLVVATDNFRSLPIRAMGDAFPKWIPHQHISLFDPDALANAVTRTGILEVAGRASVTPWELLLRTAVYRGTGRRVGGRSFDLESELKSEHSRPFKAFRLRRAFNRLWFQLASRRDLHGEMMFLAARRTG